MSASITSYGVRNTVIGSSRAKLAEVFVRSSESCVLGVRSGYLRGNVQEDHVHLVVEFPPKYSISQVVGFVKGKSAIKMFDRFPKLRNRYWGRHFWARGYCVSTVGLDEEQIKKYVQWQLKKDRVQDQLKMAISGSLNEMKW